VLHNYSSLLALDAMASEKSIRIAVYDRALMLHGAMKLKVQVSIEEIANQILEFVGGERHRLEAVDVSMKRMHRQNRIEDVLTRAEKIAEWAEEEQGGSSVDDFASDPGPAEPASEPVVIKKKTTTKKTGSK